AGFERPGIIGATRVDRDAGKLVPDGGQHFADDHARVVGGVAVQRVTEECGGDDGAGKLLRGALDRVEHFQFGVEGEAVSTFYLHGGGAAGEYLVEARAECGSELFAREFADGVNGRGDGVRGFEEVGGRGVDVFLPIIE